MGLIQVTGKVLKLPDQKAVIQNLQDFNKRLSLLDPGIYQISIVPFPEKLESMKKYYFAMEAELARYLGYKKTELHQILKSKIGFKIDEVTGKTIYESISKITDESEMLQRILEFQNFAAETHGYTFQPFEK